MSDQETLDKVAGVIDTLHPSYQRDLLRAQWQRAGGFEVDKQAAAVEEAVQKLAEEKIATDSPMPVVGDTTSKTVPGTVPPITPMSTIKSKKESKIKPVVDSSAS